MRTLRLQGDLRSATPYREIAADLYISVKTVEFHLGQILARLDPDSRTQIAAALALPGSDLGR